MRLCRFLPPFLLSLLMLRLIGNFLSFQIEEVYATSLSVTETADWITVENDYYIAKIPCDLSIEGAGGIKEFYIKPNDAANIVCDAGYPSLGGHEFCCKYNATYSKSCAYWHAGWCVESASVQVVYESSSAITVKAVVDLGGYSEDTGNWYSEIGIVEYFTFFDEPYYLVTFSKDYQEVTPQPYNPETCFLLDVDNFWSNEGEVAGTSGSYHTNSSGQISSSEADDVAWLSDANYYGKYPWLWVYNNTLNTGYGVILVDGGSTVGEVSIGHIAQGTGYKEFQIAYGRCETQLTPDIVSYVGVVDSDTDYSRIDELATDLYLSGVSPVPIEDVVFGVKSNEKHSSTAYRLMAKALQGEILRTSTSFIQSLENKGFYITYQNATASYELFASATATTPEWIHNDTYAKVVWNGQLESKLEYNWTWQAWAESDTFQMTVDIEALTNVNITQLRVRHLTAYMTRTETSNPSIVKFNFTNPSSICPSWERRGWLIKNNTNLERTVGTNTYWYMVKNVGDQEYSTGTTWQADFYVMSYISKIFQSKPAFDDSDFHTPDEKVTDYSWNVHFWLPMPLFNQESDLRFIQASGFNSSHMGYSSYSDEVLSFNVFGETGKSSTWSIYCGSKGEPTSVTGATSWSYDSGSKICTLTAQHSSSQEITLNWGPKLKLPLIKMAPTVVHPSFREWLLNRVSVTIWITIRNKEDVAQSLFLSYTVENQETGTQVKNGTIEYLIYADSEDQISLQFEAPFHKKAKPTVFLIILEGEIEGVEMDPLEHKVTVAHSNPQLCSLTALGLILGLALVGYIGYSG